MADNESMAYSVHTTSQYSTDVSPDDDFVAWAYCDGHPSGCRWKSARFYDRDEGHAIMKAEDAAVAHTRRTGHLLATPLYAEATS